MVSSAAPTLTARFGSQSRLGRALFYVHRQIPQIANPVVKAQLGALALAGEAMDYAVRLKGYGSGLTGDVAVQFATQAGISDYQLFQATLPTLKAAGLLDYQVSADGSGIAHIEEYVGLSGRVIDQALQVVERFRPTDLHYAVLHSTEIASWAPLTTLQHDQQLTVRGFDDRVAEAARKLTLAAGVNQQVWSAPLSEYVVYNPNMWGAESVGIAAFLKTLGPAERDFLLGMCEQASDRPGLALRAYNDFAAPVVNSARKVGLLQAATVRSSRAASSPQTYVFSPMQESADDQLVTTEALHQRKLFVAHMLYGHEHAPAAGGRIDDPRALVRALVTRGRVGPVTNIATDYHLLESHGIVAVRDSGSGRAYLELIKKDVVEGGLGWLNCSWGTDPSGPVAGPTGFGAANVWESPEADRANVADDGAAAEITSAAILKLREARKEAQSAARFDF